MPIQWNDYNDFDWAGAQQSSMDDGQRTVVEEFSADLLELSAADRSGTWGTASPPGRFAATVIRLRSDLQHRYREQAATSQVGDIGVKVFKANADAQREAKRVVPFHRDYIRRLPGLPNERVQRSLAAGFRQDSAGQDRAFIVQQWVVGDTLEDLVRRQWVAQPAEGTVIRSILQQLLGEIIIPLWGGGTVWWDIRDANYCYSRDTDGLAVIDVDSLGAYADEIIKRPQEWMKRDKGRVTGLARLRQMAIRLVLAQGLRGKQKVEAKMTEAWKELEPALERLGKGVSSVPEATLGLQRFLGELESCGLLHGTHLAPRDDR